MKFETISDGERMLISTGIYHFIFLVLAIVMACAIYFALNN